MVRWICRSSGDYRVAAVYRGSAVQIELAVEQMVQE